MHESLYSPEWYRIAQLKPRLRGHVTVARHLYRGSPWFIYRDETSGRTHRFSPLTHHVIGLMDGRRSTEQIWKELNEHLGDRAPTQENVAQLLAYMHSAALLATNVAADATELASRSEDKKRNDLRKRFANPLALRLKLLNPDAFLERTLPYVEWAFSPWCTIAWLVIVGLALIVAGANWHAITYAASESVLSPRNLVVMALLYPLIKLIHELGHAYATKKWHGEVNELGVLLLVLMPVPYVDASAANAFSQKSRRIVVSAAGIMVELLLASLALFLWLAAEDGIVRQIALNVMLIGGVSTLLFNGNPLLRYDGYYVLADALGTPNLGNRSNQFIGYLIHRYAFGVQNAVSPAQDDKEGFLLFWYALLSFAYRMFVLAIIVLFLADVFFFLGALLAVWAVMSQLILPAARAIARTFESAGVKAKRRRAVLAIACTAIMVHGLVFTLPIPHATVVEGVIVVNDDAHVRASVDGEIAQILVSANTRIESDQPVIQLTNSALGAQVDALRAELAGMVIQYAAEWATDPAIAEQTNERVKALEAQLAHAEAKVLQLTVRSATAGRLIIPAEQDLLGRYVTQGTTLAYVENEPVAIVKALVPQDRVPFLRQVDNVSTRIKGSPIGVLAADILRVAPSATQRLPSPVLATTGGGGLTVRETSDNTFETANKFVLVDISLDSGGFPTFIGQRVYVRFSHGTETIADRLARSSRQLFLRQFNV